MNTYRIVRHFRDIERKDVIATSLTLKQARTHCQDPETSSSTCQRPENVARTEQFGPWFDGYTAE